MKLFVRAATFAAEAHKEQKRKYTGEPYINHPLRVAQTLVEYYPGIDELIAAAVLHDVVEDCGVTEEQIKVLFGAKVAAYVMEVTNPSKKIDGNRAKRKEIDRQYLAKISDKGKSLKCSDITDNISSIVEHDVGFARRWVAEVDLLLPCLKGAHEKLWAETHKLVVNAKATIDKKLNGVL